MKEKEKCNKEKGEMKKKHLKRKLGFVLFFQRKEKADLQKSNL